MGGVRVGLVCESGAKRLCVCVVSERGRGETGADMPCYFLEVYQNIQILPCSLGNLIKKSLQSK